jgi:hypothetical protein
MHAFPTVEEVDRYITERLLIAGSADPHVFTPQAVDFIFQCSEGIPRNINNLCDNAMIAAYSAGQQAVSRQVIEEVAENLDMLPRTEMLLAADAKLDTPEGHVLRSTAAEDLSNGQARTEQVRPRVFSEEPNFQNPNGRVNGHSNGNGHVSGPSNGNGRPNGQSNGNANGGHAKPFFEEIDENVLEIGGTFYKL